MPAGTPERRTIGVAMISPKAAAKRPATSVELSVPSSASRIQSRNPGMLVNVTFLMSGGIVSSADE